MPDALLLSVEDIKATARDFETAPPGAILEWAYDIFGYRAAFGTSFQGAGLVAIHQALSLGLRFPVFTIDTGLLFPETLALKSRLEEFFGIEIESLVPEMTIEQQSAELGNKLWETNPDLCCTLRKVLPLQKKLATLDAWITGLRRAQSATRAKTQPLEVYEFDRLRGKHIVKVNPLATWSSQQVWDYIHRHNIPYNPLRDRGFRSIGCSPCTRAVISGEGERAGRWTGFEKTECGIHTFLGDNI
jgi:phosphoadenosine phosphosulfate reductase